MRNLRKQRAKGVVAALVLLLVVVAAPTAVARAGQDEDAQRPKKIVVEMLVIEATSSEKPYVDPRLRRIASGLTKVLKFDRYVLKKSYRRATRIGKTEVFVLPGSFFAQATVLSQERNGGKYSVLFALFKQPEKEPRRRGARRPKEPPKPKPIVTTKMALRPGSPAFHGGPREGPVTQILALTVY